METTVLISIPTEELRSLIRTSVNDALDDRAAFKAHGADEEYVDADGACRILGISRPTLWRLDKCGELVAFRVGRLLRYRRSDVDRYASQKAGKYAA